ncbi:MAG: alkaline phosphatase [Clostridia bacterium]|nr:alkaline phosphatase [Clostridia bacterium]
MLDNNYEWINNFSDIKNISKDKKIIGTFAEDSICEDQNRTSLSDMTTEALSRLENENGFLVMIEGSDIDTFSHKSNMQKMLIEMLEFDNAVGIAMNYVDTHPDTLLVITADHETGGLILNSTTSKEQLTDHLFTSRGNHTQTDVLVYAYGKSAEDLTQYDTIDNTSIYKFIKQGLTNNIEH